MLRARGTTRGGIISKIRKGEGEVEGLNTCSDCKRHGQRSRSSEVRQERERSPDLTIDSFLIKSVSFGTVKGI